MDPSLNPDREGELDTPLDSPPGPDGHSIRTSDDGITMADTTQVISGHEIAGTDPLRPQAILIGHSETTIHSGPFPDTKTLRELAKIYPDAPRIIFENFQA